MTPLTSTPLLSPDPDMMARFLVAIFGYTEGHVDIRMLREKGLPAGKPWTETLPADAVLGSKLVPLAERAAKDQRALFVVPGTTERPGRASGDSIFETAVVLVDLDEGDIDKKRTYLERHLGPPTLVVASGGVTEAGQAKLHLYWRLTEAARDAQLEDVARLRQTIAAKVGGDLSVARLQQPIRAAGSLHQKHGRVALCRIISDTDCDHDIEDLAASVVAMPPLGPHSRTRAMNDPNAAALPASALMTKVVRENCADGISRFDAISKVIGHWLRQVRLGRAALAEAWEAVVEHNAALIRPPWPEPRLRQDFDRLLRRDIQRNGPMSGNVGLTRKNEGRETIPPEHSEDALAEAFARMHGRDLRYVPAWGRWLVWTGTHWSEDESGRVRDAARHICRAAAISCEKPGEARRLASDKTIRAVVSIATTDRRIAISHAEWDAEPNLLNTPAGMIDLTSGEVLSHDRSRHLTQITRATPGRGCKRWLTFLDEITGGDAALVAYLQRLAGYCLTGGTEEQVFFFLHGHGANGKSVFLDTLAWILGSYARTAPAETFMSSRNPGHTTDLAGLRGARLVLVTETEANRAWAESRIKTITGGDPIAVRFMHRDNFEFRPTFKLAIAGNHRPRLTNVGEAMRRRLQLVPFEVTVAPDRRDKHLADKLRGEAGGILSWMIDGCADWRRQGLAPPETVLGASQEYMAEEDLVSQWIAEHCRIDEDVSSSGSTLFSSWSAFAEAGGFERGTQRSLAEALRAHGFRSKRTNKARLWIGISPGRAGGQP